MLCNPFGQEAVRTRLLAIGTEPAGGPAEDMRARVESDIRKWRELARTAKLDGSWGWPMRNNPARADQTAGHQQDRTRRSMRGDPNGWF